MTLFTSAGKKEIYTTYAADSRTASLKENTVMDTAYYLKCSLIYLIIAVIIGIAGAVYEHFSFGVYSNFMIYAFAVPLLGGTLPYLISAVRSFSPEKRSAIKSPIGNEYCSENLRTVISVNQCWTYHAAIATLTAGSIMQGILAICGRPNGLVIVYPITAAALLAAAAASAHTQKKKTVIKPGSESLINSESKAMIKPGPEELIKSGSKTLINPVSDKLSGENNCGGKTDKYAGSNAAEQ